MTRRRGGIFSAAGFGMVKFDNSKSFGFKFILHLDLAGHAEKSAHHAGSRIDRGRASK